MKIINLGTETAPKWFAVATVSINGEEQDIIPAFTGYSIKQKDFSKDKVYTAMDKSKILPTIFCLTDAEVFIKENVKLFDYHGREIDELPEGAPRIFVYLDKLDNINLWNLDIPIKAEVVSCDSVADAYQRVATTAYLSQCPSKDEWIGFAGIVSKDKLLLQIKKFSNNFGMSGTAAQGYFGLDTTTSFMQSKSILIATPLPKGNHRTYSQAETLMKAAVQAFGAKAAKQTRYIKAINYCLSEYGFEIVCKALNSIEADEKIKLDAAKCEDKVQCLQGIIIKQVHILHKNSDNIN